jgi:hypothetical protein
MTTRPYRPSNGTEGEWFREQFCYRCQRDAKYRETQDGQDGCRILAYTFAFDVHDPKYPKEWVQDVPAPGEHPIKNPRCTAFEPEGAK